MSWNQDNEEVPQDKLELLDSMVSDLSRLRTAKEAAEKVVDGINGETKQLEEKLIGLLKTVGRDNFNTPGVGTAYISHRQNFTTPKTGEDKVALFTFIKNKYGEEVLRSMLSIHSATLNSWAKKELEGGILEIPGLGQPTSTETIGFRREK